MLAGLSGEYIFKMPPDFCANAGSPEDRAISNTPVAAHARILPFIPSSLMSCGRLVFSWLDLWRNPPPNPGTPFLGLSFKARTLDGLPKNAMKGQDGASKFGRIYRHLAQNLVISPRRKSRGAQDGLSKQPCPALCLHWKERPIYH
jgi:hypothetical protein